MSKQLKQCVSCLMIILILFGLVGCSEPNNHKPGPQVQGTVGTRPTETTAPDETLPQETESQGETQATATTEETEPKETETEPQETEKQTGKNWTPEKEQPDGSKQPSPATEPQSTVPQATEPKSETVPPNTESSETEPPAMDSTESQATVPAPTELTGCRHEWMSIYHKEEGHWKAGIVCDCGWKVYGNAEELISLWNTHSASYPAAESLLNHGGYGCVDEWIVDKPAYDEWVCRLCGEPKP